MISDNDVQELIRYVLGALCALAYCGIQHRALRVFASAESEQEHER